MRTPALFAAAAVALLAAPSASAAVNSYTNRAAFLAAIAPTWNITFDGLAPAGGYTLVQGQKIAATTFTNTSTFLGVIDPAYAPSYYQWGSGQTLLGYYYGDPTTAALPSGTTAVGADVMVAEYNQGGVPYLITGEVTLADASVHPLQITSFAPPNRAFVGFTSTIPIVSISFYTPDDSAIGLYPLPIIDNLVYQAPTSCVTIRRGSAGAVADTHIENTKPTKNFGASVSLPAASTPATLQSLVRFDLSSLPAGAFPVSAAATFSVLLNGGISVDLHRATAAWGESTATWNSFGGAYSPTIEATLPAGSPTSANLTTLAQGWVDGSVPNHGLVLDRQGSGQVVFSSSEDPSLANRPKLDVCYVQ